MLQWRGPFDPKAFSLTVVNQQLQEKLRSVRKTTPRRCFAAREYRNGSLIPCSTTRAGLVDRVGIPPVSSENSDPLHSRNSEPSGDSRKG